MVNYVQRKRELSDPPNKKARKGFRCKHVLVTEIVNYVKKKKRGRKR